MFRECLEIASVDAVLNLVNIKPQRRVVAEPAPAPETPAENKPKEKPADEKNE